MGPVFRNLTLTIQPVFMAGKDQDTRALDSLAICMRLLRVQNATSDDREESQGPLQHS